LEDHRLDNVILQLIDQFNEEINRIRERNNAS